MADSNINRSFPKCKTCDKEFAPGGGNQWTKGKLFCSKACADKAPKVGGETRKCAGCTKEFTKRRRANDAGLYCSRECYFMAKKAGPRFTAVVIEPCSVCGGVWCRRESGVNHCSDRCQRKAATTAARDYYRTRVARAKPSSARCTECGMDFDVSPYQRGSLSEYCSQRCRSRVAKRNRRYAEAQGQQAGTVRYVDVYDRDNGKCRICGLAVDRNALPCTPLQGTIDHVWPISLHGKHSMDNVQLAHFYCNTVKSNLMKLNDEQREFLTINVTVAWQGGDVAYPCGQKAEGLL